jgi:hypothetical protein
MLAETQVVRRTAAEDVNEIAMFVLNVSLVKSKITRVEILK